MKYLFRNKNTGEVFEHTMRISEFDDYMAANPHVERYYTPDSAPILGDGMRMNTPGTGKPDSTFEKYVIQRMKDTIPGNTIKAGHKTRTPREW